MCGEIMSEPVFEFKTSKTTLLSRNVTIGKRRTSIRLEPEMWEALKDISRREGCTIHDVCSLVQLRKNNRTSLTAAIRVFLMLYYRLAATEEGHRRAGHGDFQNMKTRAGLEPAPAPLTRPIESMPALSALRKRA